MALLTDDNAVLVQIAGAVFTVICAMLYQSLYSKKVYFYYSY